MDKPEYDLWVKQLIKCIDVRFKAGGYKTDPYVLHFIVAYEQTDRNFGIHTKQRSRVDTYVHRARNWSRFIAEELAELRTNSAEIADFCKNLPLASDVNKENNHIIRDDYKQQLRARLDDYYTSGDYFANCEN